jgi:pimeloyl-ACP methyl ester carboxylesterase
LALIAAAWLIGPVVGDGLNAGSTGVRFAQVDGRRVAYRVTGRDRPVLVLISGLGDGMNSFNRVAADLATNATVIVYDRAGYGRSDAATSARDAAAVDRELAGVLEASRISGPYLVAGHSSGGLYAEYFAAHHPDKVSGLILAESRPADFGARCRAARLGMCSPPSALVRFLPRGARDEVAALDRSTEEILASDPSTAPVLVLSRPAVSHAPTFDALWSEAQDDLARRYGARHLRAPSGGHYIHVDQREWFIAQLKAFMADKP